jgi:hypothetical protein
VRREGDDIVLLALYVDDIVIAGSNLELVESIKQQFSKKFEMKDLGELKHYLGMQIERDGIASLKIHQADYARKVIKKYRKYLKDGRYKAKIPMAREIKLSKDEEMTEDQLDYVRAFPYQEIIGSLMYLAVNTRPDIAYAVNTCARFSSKPNYTACRSVLRILAYVSKTYNVGITYYGTEMDFHGFSDADWGGNRDNARSTTGFLTFMAGGPITWQSKLQTTVATSSMEAEYMALYAVIQDICWLRGLMSEIGFELNEPTQVLVDSQSAIDLAHNPVHHQRSKHINIKFHWLRDKIKLHVVSLKHVPTLEQLADMLTKALTEEMHAYCVKGVVM